MEGGTKPLADVSYTIFMAAWNLAMAASADMKLLGPSRTKAVSAMPRPSAKTPAAMSAIFIVSSLSQLT